jgi:hypothetical protein
VTLSLLRTEIWQQIGEPSDLDPTTDVQYGGLPLLNWVVNEGQRQIAFWKDPATARVFRHANLYGECFFQPGWRSETLPAQAGAGTSEVILSAGCAAVDDAYNGWVLTTTTETKVIMDYVGATRLATVSEAFSTAPVVADVVELCPRVQLLLLASHALAADNIVLPVVSDRFRAEGNFLEVLKLMNVADQNEIVLAEKVSSFDLLATGSPTKYFRKGNALYFDSAWDSADWVQMEYYRAPTDMLAATDEPELAEQYHYAVALWGLWWGFRRAGDNASAYNVQRDITAYIQRTVSLAEVRDDRRNDYGKLRRT